MTTDKPSDPSSTRCTMTFDRNSERVFEHAEIAAIVLDEALCIQYFSTRAIEIASQIRVGGCLADLSTLFCEAELTELCRTALRDGTTVDEYATSVNRRRHRIKVSCCQFEESGSTGVLLTWQDVTRYAAVESALNESESFCRVLLDGSPVCNKIVDLDSNLVFMSQAGIDGLKIPNIADFYGHPYPPEFFPHEMKEALNERLERAKQGEVCSVECQLFDTEGEEIWYDATFVPARDSNGNVEYVIVASVNITDRKRAEEHLRHAQTMEAVGRLASGIAHEFNNILAGILTNVEWMLGETESKQSCPFVTQLTDIKRMGNRGAELTRQLLSFARTKRPNVSLFDVNELINGCRRILEQVAGKRIELVTDLSSNPLLVRADESDLERAIVNLVLNSRDAMESGGKLEVKTEAVTIDDHPKAKPGAYVCVRVTDTGCGIPEDKLAKIFEPFFTTKPGGEGTGLGLTAVFADIENADGFVTVESEVGVGTTFQVFVPQASGRIAPARTREKQTSLPRGDETLLVCDDEEIVLNSVSALLGTLGYSILTANSPEAALAVVRDQGEAISLLLTDLVMPGMNGYELAEEVRKLRAELPIILTSGGGPQSKSPFNVVEKPIDFQQLANLIRDTLNEQ